MVTSNPFRIYLLLLAGLCLLQGSLACAALTASVDRTAISENDIINLTLRSTDGTIAQGGDFAAMLPDFTILNSQRSNQISFINGQRSSHYDLVLTLAPNRNGTLTIPAFSGNGESTPPITIRVAAGAGNPQQEPSDVFIETSVSKDTVYVQQQLILTVKIHHAVGLNEASISAPKIPNTLVQQLGENSRQETMIKGVRYSVIERNYALFPQASGPLEIPEQILSGRTLSRFGNVFRSSGRFVRVKSKPIAISVLPKPESFPAGEPWLPAQALTINDSWEALAPEIKAGEPATRTITVTARGVTAAQLPPIQLPEVKGLKMYADQPQRDEQATARGLVAEQTIATAVVPTSAGSYNIPPIRIYWWNTDSDKLMTSLIIGKNILASAASSVPQPPLSEPAGNNMAVSPTAQEYATGPEYWLWPALAALFLLLWLVTIFLWWATKNRGNTDNTAPSGGRNRERLESPNQAHRQLREACRTGDMARTRVALLAWFKAAFSDQSIETLDDIRQMNCHPELAPILVELDAMLYGNTTTGSPWDGQPLLNVLEKIKKTAPNKARQQKSRSLSPLYSETG